MLRALLHINQILKRLGYSQSWRMLLKSTEDWGPAHEREKKLKVPPPSTKEDMNGQTDIGKGAYLNQTFAQTTYESGM